jgi:hypothetical protein
MQYTYPKVSGGFRWNALKRCLNEIGIEPVSMCDVEESTFFQFDRELTVEEKSGLDALMQDDPQHPKKGETVLKIVDIWERFDDFKRHAGLPELRLYYSETVEGSGLVDQIELQHPTPLSSEQIESIKQAYISLIK